MTLGECINNYLNDHDGMSMRKFAALAGVSHSYISNIVNGKNSRGKASVPTINVYKGIAKAMGIDVNDLISMVDDKIAWGEQKNPATKDDGMEKDYQELKQILDQLTPENAVLLKEQAQLLLRHQKSQDGQ